MDSELLRWLYHRLMKDVTWRRTRRCRFSDGLIALAGLHAVANNRSARWTSDRRNWPVWFKPALPSYSQLRRRLLRPSIGTLMRQLDQQLQQRLGHGNRLSIDGFVLTVPRHSRDRDAKVGYVRGGFARGYKLHAVRDAASGVIRVAGVYDLSRGEAAVARRLVRRVRLSGHVLRADANYDSNVLYADVSARGGRLVAPRRKTGRGISRSHRQHPDRLAAIATLEHDPAARRHHASERGDIERGFADLRQRMGLFALPPFVRRRRRVRCWIRAKLLLYHLVLCIRHNA
jgi:hypothetical protein